jgi:hypothetical protein
MRIKSKVGIMKFRHRKKEVLRIFMVRVEGRNFLLEFQDKIDKFGFYATRTIEAANEKAAEFAAMDVSRAELNKIVKNERTDPPMMYSDELWEVEKFDGKKEGYAFFPDEEFED